MGDTCKPTGEKQSENSIRKPARAGASLSIADGLSNIIFIMSFV